MFPSSSKQSDDESSFLGTPKPSSPPPSSDPLDRLFALLMTQNADGSFAMSLHLENWLGSRSATIKSEAKQNPAIVTAVVLALLQKEASQHQAEWKRAATKARTYLQKHGNPNADHLI